MKFFKYTGRWWLPSQEKCKVSGTVKFAENNRINLSLKGLLEPDRNRAWKQSFKKYPLILGVTNDGQPVTLFDCFDSKLTMSSSGHGKHECSATVAYIGTYFTDSQEIRFNKMDIHYSYLPQWAGVFPFRGHQKPFDEVRASTEKWTITIQSTRRLGESWIDEAELSDTVWFRVETQEALSLDEWTTQFISPLQNLLTLATQRPNALVGVQAYVKQNAATQSNGDVSEISVQVVFQPPFVPITPSRTVFPETLLFSLQEVANGFEHTITSWLRASEELDSVCNLFFGMQYSKLSLNQRFLFTAQAAESYQDRRVEKLYLPEDDYQRLMEVILAGCPEDHREWLKEKIQYSNSPSFRSQLKDLVEKTSSLLLPLLEKSGQRKKAFLDTAYDTRNYLTHHTKELEAKAARGDKLFFITQQLYIAIEVCLLYELGFTSDRCEEMFLKHETYQYLLRLVPYSS